MEQRLIVIMGPSGCGKSSVVWQLSRQVAGAIALEADDFHSPENRAKMESGQALTDMDRVPWIQSIRDAVGQSSAQTALIACSALTPFVQGHLRNIPERTTRFILLDVPKSTLQARLDARTGHFMPPELLGSQLEALSCPDDAIVIDGDQPLHAVMRAILAIL